MLEVRALETAYGASQVLFGIEFDVRAGEVVTLMGRNGMGKTTTIHSIMGLVKSKAGSVKFENAELTGKPSYAVARCGLGLVPEGRQVFPNLTVRENLVATARKSAQRVSGRWSVFLNCSLLSRREPRTWGRVCPAVSNRCLRSAAR